MDDLHIMEGIHEEEKKRTGSYHKWLTSTLERDITRRTAASEHTTSH
jgi:hypothetical protein